MTHPPEFFEALLDYIVEAQIPVMTLDQLLGIKT